MRLSLAEQINQLGQVGPTELDPENVQTFDTDEHVVASVHLTTKEHYPDAGWSTLHTFHDSLSDPKYDSVKTTRKRLSQEEDNEVEVDGDVVEGDKLSEMKHHEHRGGANEIPSEGGGDNKKSPTSSRTLKKSAQDYEPPDDFTSTLQKTRDDDRKKGRAISRQIALWDNILDARIRMQKSVSATSGLPVPSELRSCWQSRGNKEAIHGMMEEVLALTNEIFELQEDLLTSNESITVPPRKRRKIQAEDTFEDYALCLAEAAQVVSTVEQSLHPHLVQTLSKWSSKIQAVAPSMLLPSNRHAFLTKSSQQLKSVGQLIDETLADHDKLLARTRVRRGKGARVGDPTHAKEVVAEHKELFDDTDFYQQLLRDVIDARGNGIGGGDDWMTAQRQKKTKKTVDTKASKGRKIRYEVHEKLQNFMVPVPMVGVWHEEQIDELFSSLLGKGLQNSMGRLNDEEHDQGQVDEALKGGFRVFG